MGWRGFNCSIPHKVAVIAHLDGLGKSAEIIGAVNTIVRVGDRLIGENTDGRGFVAALREVVDPKGKSVVRFGAGGGARAVAVEMALAGAARILIVNRSAARGQEVVDLLNTRTPTLASYAAWIGPFAVPQDTDIVTHHHRIGIDTGPVFDTDHPLLHQHPQPIDRLAPSRLCGAQEAGQGRIVDAIGHHHVRRQAVCVDFRHRLDIGIKSD